MKKRGFTLIELLAVIVILAIVLAIAIPGISNIISNSTKSLFESDAKMVIKTINYKLYEDSSYAVDQINIDKVNSDLKLSTVNYTAVSVQKDNNGNPYITIQGKNKWNGLVACGTYNNMLITENIEQCPGIPPVGALYWHGTEIVSWIEGYDNSPDITPAKKSDNLNFNNPGEGSYFNLESTYVTEEMVDLTNWNYLKAQVALKINEITIWKTISIDISGITGEHYIRIHGLVSWGSPVGSYVRGYLVASINRDANRDDYVVRGYQDEFPGKTFTAGETECRFYKVWLE